MSKVKTLLLSSMVTGAMLLGGGCVPNLDRLFNVWDFGISLAATLAGTNVAALLGGLGT